MAANNKLEMIHYILNNKVFKANELFDDHDLLESFSYRHYTDDEFMLIGYSYKNAASIYEYINLNMDFLLKTQDKILNEICWHLQKYKG